MALYTPVNPDLAGAAPNLVAVSASDTFQNNGKALLHVKNGNAAACSVVIASPGSTAPPNATAFTPAVTVSVPATTGERYIGPFDPSRFNDANGIVTVTYSVTPTVTAEVIDVA